MTVRSFKFLFITCQCKMSSGWERIRQRVETGEELQKDTRTLSTHILDTSLGKAACGVPVAVYHMTKNQQWHELKLVRTDKDGRANQLLEANAFESGIYKLKFDIEKYYDGLGVPCFYPFVEIVIKCSAGQHYHVPLLLSPFGYTTYRGT